MTGLHGTNIALEAAAEDGGQRLDRLLAAKIDGLSRSRAQALIRQGCVRKRGATVWDAGERVKSGDTVEISMPPVAPAEPLPETIALSIVHEDQHLIVVDKPAGMVVHPSAGHAHGTLVNALLAHCGESLSGIGGERRPGIVHRLDKDTSGLLVVAKTDMAHRALAAQFASHGRDGRLERRYVAFAWGVPLRPDGVIDAPLGRSVTDRKKIAPARAGQGRRAVTRYKVIERFMGAKQRPVASLLELRLETGRTHQIRVHLAHIGHPVMGDATYGVGFKSSTSVLAPPARAVLGALGRQALHAASLAFEHPATGRKVRFESPLPPDLVRLYTALEEPPV